MTRVGPQRHKKKVLCGYCWLPRRNAWDILSILKPVQIHLLKMKSNQLHAVNYLVP